MTDYEKQLLARLVESVEDLLAAAVDEKSNDVIALKSADPPVIRAYEVIAEARALLAK